MKIKLIEMCKHEGSNGEYSGVRVVFYNSSAKDLVSSIIDYQNNFNSVNVVTCRDSFNTPIIDSYLYSALIAE